MAPAAARTPPRHRTWPQRLLIGFNALVVFLCVSGAGGVGYVYWRFGQLPRLALDALTAPQQPGTPRNFLLVGSDSRASIDPDDPTAGAFLNGEHGGGQLADTIMILRLDPASERAALLSIPRDLWVTIRPDGDRSKINGAFRDGADGLVQTISTELGIPIHNYSQVDFSGFRALVDAIDGVPIYFAAPARDSHTGLNIPTAGCHTLDGDDALAYARSRYYQSFESGRWRTDPTSDLGRISRQQEFIRQVIRRTINTRNLLNPLTVNRLIDVGVSNLTIDDGLGLDQIRSLAGRFRAIDPDTIDMFSLPTTPATLGSGAQVLLLKEEEAQPVLDIFRGLDPSRVTPSGTRVRVLNGTGRPGQAGDVADALSTISFSVAGTGDAQGQDGRRTLILFAPGEEEKAILLWRHLGVDAQLLRTQDLGTVDVVLVTGLDFTTVLERPKSGEPELPAATTTSTTEPDDEATTTTTEPRPVCG